MAELDALPWDELLFEFLLALELRRAERGR